MLHTCCRWAVALLLAGLLHAGPGLAKADDDRYTITPLPDWARLVEPDTDAEAPDAYAGTFWNLAEIQVRLQPGHRHVLGHYAGTALAPAGVDNLASLSFVFDPSYEHLNLHFVRVLRDGRVLDRLADAQINVLQREPELERQIYDGSLTVNLILADVRVGDTVEYAYSVEGTNPVFGGHHHGAYRLNWGTPAGRVRLRMLVAESLRLQTRVHNGKQVAPLVRGGYREYLWDARDVAAVPMDEDAPSWFNPWTRVAFTTHPDWASVAQWALPMYQPPTAISGELAELVERIRNGHETDAGRLMAALRFVQSEIRYLGIEMGANSHAPTDPVTVLRRRFGDCKDMSLLLLTLLHHLDIPASAALVNTGTLRAEDERLPSPTAFDHVLVRTSLGSRVLWLDPTWYAQEGTPDTMAQPWHGMALVVHPSTTALESMDSALASHAPTTTHVLLESATTDDPITYTVLSSYHGYRAEAMRGNLASQDHAELARGYLDFYAARYPGTEQVAPLDVKDDTTGNRIRTTETYRIPGGWVRANEQGLRTLDASAHELLDHLPRLPVLERNGPLHLPWPLDLTQVRELRIPAPWTPKDAAIRIENPAFVFERSSEANGTTTIVTDSFRTLQDHVPLEHLKAYHDDLGRVRALLDLTLNITEDTGTAGAAADASTPPAAHSGFASVSNWPNVLFAALVVLLLLPLARRIHRWDPAPRRDGPGTGPSGIGGWLLLPTLGLVMHPILLFAQFSDSSLRVNQQEWNLLTTPGTAAYHELWAPVLFFETGALVLMSLLILLAAVAFATKRRSAPILMIALLWTGVARLIGYLLLLSGLPVDEADVAVISGSLPGAIGAAVLWSIYFRVSTRVRATFVRGHGEQRRDAPARASASEPTEAPAPPAESPRPEAVVEP